jgi:hypothetical protein
VTENSPLFVTGLINHYASDSKIQFLLFHLQFIHFALIQFFLFILPKINKLQCIIIYYVIYAIVRNHRKLVTVYRLQVFGNCRIGIVLVLGAALRTHLCPLILYSYFPQLISIFVYLFISLIWYLSIFTRID